MQNITACFVEAEPHAKVSSPSLEEALAWPSTWLPHAASNRHHLQHPPRYKTIHQYSTSKNIVGINAIGQCTGQSLRCKLGHPRSEV
jgi:hypothetical protein